jgi:hypothetical protein
MDIICPYRGILIPFKKKQGILGEVVHAQVVHMVVFMPFILLEES